MSGIEQPNPAVIFTPGKRGLNEQDISGLEKRLSFALPEPYRSFLLHFNCPEFSPAPHIATPPDSYLCYNAPPDGDVEEGFVFVVHSFEYLDDTLGAYDIRQSYDTKTGIWAYPREFLPVVYDPGGMTFSLALDGPGKGRIYVAGQRYLDAYNDAGRDFDSGEATKAADFWEVAPDFGHFLKNLYWDELL